MAKSRPATAAGSSSRSRIDDRAEVQATEEPPSPKKQKTQGRPDQRDVVEPLPSPYALINPASGEEKLAADPMEEEEEDDDDDDELPVSLDEHGRNRNSKFYEQMVACSVIGRDPEEPMWWFDSDDETAEEREITRRETAMIAKEALDSYNEKNKGVKYVLDEPRRSCKTLFHLAIVTHFNFTAREENNPSSCPHRFFAETVTYYGGRLEVPTCIDLESFAPGSDQLHKACIYCPEEIEHPPEEICVYGKNTVDDWKKFEYETAEDEVMTPDSPDSGEK
ncbi:unnamed protein product [Linum tenue]|uniref:DUF3615 domain-containing protein n=1 Tax=Linum tenue TaxID=586396 RepID=A0AAV0NLS7_9ROSI|nr:unnamed protein product [Linum tenue]